MIIMLVSRHFLKRKFFAGKRIFSPVKEPVAYIDCSCKDAAPMYKLCKEFFGVTGWNRITINSNFFSQKKMLPSSFSHPIFTFSPR